LLIDVTRAGPFPISIDAGEKVVSLAVKGWDDPSGSKSEPSQLTGGCCAANANGVNAGSKKVAIRTKLFLIPETPIDLF
jgi:hypothetical protein